MSDRLLSIPKAAERLGGVSPWTVRDLIRSRQLGHTRVRRRLLVPESEIDRYIAANTVQARGTIKPQLHSQRKEDTAGSASTGRVTRLLDIREICGKS